MKRIAGVLVAGLVVMGLASCGASGGDALQSPSKNGSDTQSDTRSDTNSDTNSDTASDTNSDTSSDGDITSDDQVDPAVQEFADEMDAVQATVTDYWTQALTDDTGTSSYVAPEQTYQFIGSTDPAPTCGGEDTGPENAFFCPPDNSLIYDVEWLFNEYETIGDTFIYVIIAHEFGHSAQWNLNQPDDPQDTELQADCFAGGLLQYEIDLGNITLEPGDEEEMNQTLAFLSNEYGSTESHGTLSQRSGAFEYGRTNGAQGCLDTASYIHWN